MIDWLQQAAHTSTPLACFGLWVAGCVVALRRRPAAGAAFAAAGFGLLALMEVVSLLYFFAYVLHVRFGIASFGFPDAVTLAISGLGGIAQIAGTVLVVAGVGLAWRRNTVNRSEPPAFDELID